MNEELNAYDLRILTKEEKSIDNLLNFWKNLDGDLPKVAIRLLSCPASSIPLESYFKSRRFAVIKQL